MRRLALSTIAACLVVMLILAGCDSAAPSASGSTSSSGSTNTSSGTGTSPDATNTTAPSTGAGSATLTMGSFSFEAPTSLQISAGQAVTFNDPSATGGIHNLVTGTNGTFAAAPGAPSEFASSSGVSFNPGTSKTFTFPTAGTYSITCTIHPSMEATITVS